MAHRAIIAVPVLPTLVVPADTAAIVCESCRNAQISKSSRASYLNVKSCQAT